MNRNYEAIEAGKKAIDSLNEALSLIDSASNWGLFDIFGGNSFVSLVKYSKLDRAKAKLYECKDDMWDFKNELEIVPFVDIDIDPFLAFTDLFCDKIVEDLIVQSRIYHAKREVINTINTVERALNNLRLL